MPYTFLPGVERVGEIVQRDGDRLDAGATLVPGGVYVGRCTDRLALPDDVFAIANPKSSVGRLDVHVRVFAENGEAYDRIPKGYKGALWVEIVPRTFPVVLFEGEPVAQLRFVRDRLAPLTGPELAEYHAREPIVRYTPLDSAMDAAIRTDRDEVILSANTRGAKNEIVGFRAQRAARALRIGFEANYDPERFWTPLRAADALILEPGEFYLLRSRELLSVPADLCAELVPFDADAGEFRAHYAGFFDNGFGLGCPSAAVLEVRNHHAAPMRIAHGQPFGRMRFHRFAEPPMDSYGGRRFRSHYQGQRLALPKQFRPFQR